jgi:DNA-binding NarL/FixJ family response regulator
MPRSAKKCLILVARHAAEPVVRKPAPLSQREIEILLHMREGSTDKEIARLLGLSERTVQHHVQSICQKLSAANRTQAVVTALRRRIVPLH